MKTIFNILILSIVLSIFIPQTIWTRQSNSLNGVWLRDVQFLNNSTAVAVGHNLTVVKTTDAGHTWTVKNSGDSLSPDLSGVNFIDILHGVTVGSGGSFFLTSDGGESWAQLDIGTTNTLQAVDYVDSNTIVVVGRNYGLGGTSEIMYSTNKGSSWSYYATNNWMFDVSYIDNQVGTAVGDNGKLFNTTNGGISWTATTLSVTPRLFSAYFISRYNGWVIGDYLIYNGSSSSVHHTLNGGQSWFSVAGFDSVALRDIAFANANIGVIVGTVGVVFYTNNGGDTWSQSNIGNHYIEAVSFNGDGVAICVGKNGFVARSTDNGAIWEVVITAVTEELQPLQYNLQQNFPNPFNPTTSISYSLSKTEWVELKVYNLLGSEVATLVDEQKYPGNYEVSWDASGFSSGVYFYKMVTGASTLVKKMVLIR